MEDPVIQSFAKPLSIEERQELGSIQFADYNYYLAFVVHVGSFGGDLPSEVGSFVADVIDTSTLKHSPVEILDCSQVLPEQTMSNSRIETAAAVSQGNLKCLDVNNSVLSLYADGRSNSYETLKVQFKFCIDSRPNDSSCMSREQATEWFKSNQVYLDYFESQTVIDFSREDGY